MTSEAVEDAPARTSVTPLPVTDRWGVLLSGIWHNCAGYKTRIAHVYA